MRARSVDVVPESSGVMHGDLPTSQRDDPGPLKRRQEAAGALARGAGQVRDLRLGGADQHVRVGRAVGLARSSSGRAGRSPPGRPRSGTTAGAAARSCGSLARRGWRAASGRGRGCGRTRRWTSVASSATRRRRPRSPPRWPSAVSPRNIASSPNSMPARSSASATMRPSWCSRVSTIGARSEQVAGVAHVALAEDHLAAVPVPRNGDLRHLLQLARLDLAEDLGRGEQADGLVHGGHAAHNPTWSGRRP